MVRLSVRSGTECPSQSYVETEEEEETQRGPAAAPRGLTGAGEATQGGWEATGQGGLDL